MKNILVYEMPTKIEVDSKQYKIRSDFRVAILTFLAFEDNELTLLEKHSLMLSNIYEVVPINFEEATKQAVLFLNGGTDGSEHEVDNIRTFSFDKDAGLIYAAFQQTHGIDLETIEYMHFWKFMSLFMDLGQDTIFCQITALRKRVLTGRASKQDREMAMELGDIFELDNIEDYTSEEREAKRLFEEALAEGERRQRERLNNG